MQYSTFFFYFQTLHTFFPNLYDLSFVVEALVSRGRDHNQFFCLSFAAQVNYSTMFVFLEVEINIDVFLSFVAEANVNAIFYIFHFQTLHIVFWSLICGRD